MMICAALHSTSSPRRNFYRALPGLFLPACLLLLVFPTGAQTATPPVRETSPVPLVAADAASPDVHPDHSVTFSLLSPNAKKVSLVLEGSAAPQPMAQDATGLWTVTIPALKPEFYSYAFKVDDADVLDPHNTTLKTSYFSNQNVFLVPGQPISPWEIQNVPHGVLHRHSYQSQIVVRSSDYFVYTPPAFNPASKTAYPVLYLLHGYSDDPTAWPQMGKANVIFDNLIAQGKMKPMIVVMPLGYGDMQMITRGWIAWRDPQLVLHNFSQFSDALYGEVMPRVKVEYPILPGRENHAIAGLSMGGAESLLVGLNHLNDFAYVAGFSAGGLGDSGFQRIFPDLQKDAAAKQNGGLRLLWISCGTEDGLLQPNEKLVAWLRTQGMTPKAVETPGMHAWMVWRENLAAFAPLLFQSKNSTVAKTNSTVTQTNSTVADVR